LNKFGATAFALALAAMLGTGCAKHENATHPTGALPGPSFSPPAAPALSPTPTPTPTPAPVPTPSPTAAVRAVVRLVPRNLECKPGVAPPAGTNPFRVGCSVEVRVEYMDAHGAPVPETVTGNSTEWRVAEGASRLTLPWDENPWRRWLTAKSAGPYRIVVTLTMKKTHEKVVGELEGELAH
jgi:hypothetical protein